MGLESKIIDKPEVGTAPRLAVVIPSFRAASTIAQVLAAIGNAVERIYVVDDACPESSGAVALALGDPRVEVLINLANLGVGGAVKRGYRAALAQGMEIVVKLDADFQMDPAQIGRLIAPIVAGQADYAKGNRFAPPHLMPPETSDNSGASRAMPGRRRLGNNLASFLHKAVTGHWHVLDPANGFTAIDSRALRLIDLDAVADCYFFETDMLFQLNLIDAVVADVAIPARYNGEVSSLRLRHVIARYPLLGLKRCVRRLWTRYFIEDFNVASLEIAIGLPLLLFGTVLGLVEWALALDQRTPATAGTVMLAALPIILGFQMLLAAIGFDIARRPTVPISRRVDEAC